MRPSSIRSGYKDNLTRKRRTNFLFKIILFVLLGIAIAGGIVYILFFSRVLEVQSLTLNGLATLDSEQLKSQIYEKLESKYFGYLPRKGNILFLNLKKIEREIQDKYTILKSVKIERDLAHSLVLNFVERKPVGIWCFETLVQCYYFDMEKNMWSSPAKSSGFLMLSVRDKRINTDEKIDDEYFNAVKLILENSQKYKMSFEGIEIEDSFRDLKVMTSENYYLILSLDSDIQNQLELLKIFLDNKTGQDAFNPQYLDLRVDGRVYYK